MPDRPASLDTYVALAERIRAGDPSAEAEFIRLFQEKLLIMLQARTRNWDVARELAQDVLVAVVRALRNGRMREAERLSAFVYGTALNTLKNYLRTRAHRPVEIPLTPEDAMVDPGPEMEDASALAVVRQAVEELDATDRRIISLTLVQGLKPAEIAEKLGLSPEVVRQRKSRAIKKVADCIKKLSRK